MGGLDLSPMPLLRRWALRMNRRDELVYGQGLIDGVMLATWIDRVRRGEALIPAIFLGPVINKNKTSYNSVPDMILFSYFTP